MLLCPILYAFAFASILAYSTPTFPIPFWKLNQNPIPDTQSHKRSQQSTYQRKIKRKRNPCEVLSIRLRWLLAVAMGFGYFLCKAWPWPGFHEIFYKLCLLFIYKSKEPIFICIQLFSVICISISKVILVWISLFSWW